jgi:hypothetical protein
MAFRSSQPLLSSLSSCNEAYYDKVMGKLYFYHNTLVDEVKIFRCHQNKTCPAIVSIREDGVIALRGQHVCETCTVTENEYINRQAVQQIKLNSQTVYYGDVYETMINSLKDSKCVPQSYIDEKAILHMASKSSLKASMSRHKRRSQPNLPVDLEQLHVVLNDANNDHMSNFTLLGSEYEKFVFHKSIIDSRGGLCLIFTCESCLAELFQSTTIYFDGTFKVIPQMFKAHSGGSQLVSFSKMVQGNEEQLTRKKLFPLLFALLPGKSETLYSAFFDIVKGYAADRQVQIMWQNIVMDFEQASRNALQSAFPEVIGSVRQRIWL